MTESIGTAGVAGIIDPQCGSFSSLTTAMNFFFSGRGDYQFNSPKGIVSDGRLLFVSDTGNNRVSVFVADATTG